MGVDARCEGSIRHREGGVSRIPRTPQRDASRSDVARAASPSPKSRSPESKQMPQAHPHAKAQSSEAAWAAHNPTPPKPTHTQIDFDAQILRHPCIVPRQAGMLLDFRAVL